MAWIVLLFAGLLEIGWAVGLKYSSGLTRPVPTLITVVAMVASVGLLGIAVRTLPLSTAYAIWTGIGTLGVALAGFFVLGEPASFARLCFLMLIVIGIVGLKLA